MQNRSYILMIENESELYTTFYIVFKLHRSVDVSYRTYVL